MLKPATGLLLQDACEHANTFVCDAVMTNGQLSQDVRGFKRAGQVLQAVFFNLM